MISFLSPLLFPSFSIFHISTGASTVGYGKIPDCIPPVLVYSPALQVKGNKEGLGQGKQEPFILSFPPLHLMLSPSLSASCHSAPTTAITATLPPYAFGGIFFFCHRGPTEVTSSVCQVPTGSATLSHTTTSWFNLNHRAPHLWLYIASSLSLISILL